ncbi:MAG: BrnA antitoxin family protein [Chloroflexota bacterium]|nr:BrnA antitoxin family protein [Chloroflexota bacterium]
MSKRTTTEPITTISSLEEIPRFNSEQEEAIYWQAHALSDTLWATLPSALEEDLPPTRPRTRSVAIRFDDSTLQRMKALAHRRHKGYQTLLKEFVVERLYEEEKREGLIG